MATPFVILVNDNCPMAICERGSSCVIRVWNGCPICTCNDGRGTRNSCKSQAECGNGSQCLNSLCSYRNVPRNLPEYCSFDNQCKFDESCTNNACTPGAPVHHLEDVSCVSRNKCTDPNYVCNSDKMTCYKAGPGVPQHLPGRSCVFRRQCKNGYRCEDMSCLEDTNSGIQHIEGLKCVFDRKCPAGYRCDGLTCVKRE